MAKSGGDRVARRRRQGRSRMLTVGVVGGQRWVLGLWRLLLITAAIRCRRQQRTKNRERRGIEGAPRVAILVAWAAMLVMTTAEGIARGCGATAGCRGAAAKVIARGSDNVASCRGGGRARLEREGASRATIQVMRASMLDVTAAEGIAKGYDNATGCRYGRTRLEREVAVATQLGASRAMILVALAVMLVAAATKGIVRGYSDVVGCRGGGRAWLEREAMAVMRLCSA
ncbi:hypothetical protein BHE74_00002974 [Ensete ventricosum]|nr:hypothetical protein BHE74_00002974 [Ensete ventricosum]